ncbi:hypothetical protein [Aeromonas salmonicida]|uniref:hypothetical protein n=1 Tax=Aeromonas salmonicida TaxID=645 RepID=UPI003D24D106
MTTDYTHQDSKLTFLFPELLEVSSFELVEYRATAEINKIRHPDHVFVFTLTLLDEQPCSALNQALQKAISDKALVQLSLTRNGSTYDWNVVVGESATKKPNDYRLSVVKT